MTIAVCIILDVGPHMSPDITEAVECLKLLVQRKFFAEKKEELAIVLCGTAFDDDDDNRAHPNITLIRELSPIDWDVLEFLNSDSLLSTEQADLMDAVFIGSEHLTSRCKNRKEIKELRLLLVSNLNGPASKTKAKTIVEAIKSADIRVSLIGYRLSNENTASATEFPADGPSNYYPHDNADVKIHPGLDAISELWSGLDGESFTFSEALPALAYFETRSVAQRGWKTELQIGGNLSIPTEGFSLVREAHPPTLKLAYAANPSVAIKSNTTYYAQDEVGTELNPSQLIRGYRYGGTVLSLSDEDMLAVKQDSEKCLSVIGFTDATNVPPNLYIGDSVLAFVPANTTTTTTDSPSASSLAALAQALFEMNKVAIVRRVYNRISAPRIGVLTPEIRDNQVILLYTDITFAEDVRNITFPSLPVWTGDSNCSIPSTSSSESSPSELQLRSMNAFVDCMLLDDHSSERNDQLSGSEPTGPEGDQEQSGLQPERIPNPWIQRLFSCFRERGLNQALPSMESSISAEIEPPLLDPRNLPGFESVLSRISTEDHSDLSEARRDLVHVLPRLSVSHGSIDNDSSSSAVSTAKRRRLMPDELSVMDANKSEQATASDQYLDPLEESHNHIAENEINVEIHRLDDSSSEPITNSTFNHK